MGLHSFSLGKNSQITGKNVGTIYKTPTHRQCWFLSSKEMISIWSTFENHIYTREIRFTSMQIAILD